MRARKAAARAAALLLTAVSVAACGPHAESGARAGEATAKAREVGAARGSAAIRFLGADDGAGFARATAPRAFSFPGDHGSHDEFRSEWWYFTGNLEDTLGAAYGFELTFFRVALSPQAAARESRWGAHQVWMAHFAVTDVADGRFFAAERFARGALGLAGASGAPFRVWLEGWEVSGSADGSAADLALSARDGETGLSLRLEAATGPVAQGNAGLDVKGPEPGNASFYYSIPRLSATGSLSIDGVARDVRGSAWMDREWGTSALSPGVVGWDWFALQLADGRDLMFYRLRGADGTATEFSGGSLVEANGRSRQLGARDVSLAPLRYWTSPATGVRYPVAWRMEVPSEGLELEVLPRLDDQEIDLSVRYWEGAVTVSARARGAPLEGRGYLELAGY
jgi:predicted secreted hydrolase